MKQTWKKAAAFALSLAMSAAPMAAEVGSFTTMGGTGLVAHATEPNPTVEWLGVICTEVSNGIELTPSAKTVAAQAMANNPISKTLIGFDEGGNTNASLRLEAEETDPSMTFVQALAALQEAGVKYIVTEEEYNAHLAAMDFIAKVEDAETATITLESDIDLTLEPSFHGLDIAKNLTLDLNGFSLDIGSVDNSFDPPALSPNVINVENNEAAVTLTINDSQGTGQILHVSDLMAYNDECIVINGGTINFYWVDDCLSGASADNFTLNGGTFVFENESELGGSIEDYNDYLGQARAFQEIADNTYAICTTLDALDIDEYYSQTAVVTEVNEGIETTSYYKRFVFVRPKSDLDGKYKATFTVPYDGQDYTYYTSYYYTAMTANNIRYIPANENCIFLIVTVKSSNDICDELTCTISLT